MKKIILFFLTLLGGFSASADLLERVNLEDALRSRLEQSFRVYDESARITVRFDYKSYQDVLPGTAIPSNGSITPSKIESSDISRIWIEVYTDLAKAPPEAKDVLLKLVPLEKSKVSIDFKQAQANTKPLPRSLEPQDLSDLMDKSLSSMGKFLLALCGIALFVTLGLSAYQNAKGLKEFKEQFHLLVKAIGEGNLEKTSRAPASQTASQNIQQAPMMSKEDSPLERLNPSSIYEIFADSYWCKEDSYAHWLWKNLKADQKKDLLSALPYMKDYSLYFVTVPPQAFTYHDHPSYMEPLSLTMYSQEDLGADVAKQLSLWQMLTPMRQQSLPLNFELKLQAVQHKPTKKLDWKPKADSTLRTLNLKPIWGDLTIADEIKLQQNPELVPSSLKKQMRSLVWLAQKDDTTIQKALSKMNAMSLAMAWVGPEDILKKLESHLPEKKLKLLKTYQEKVAPTKQSDAFQALVDEGLKDDAA